MGMQHHLEGLSDEGLSLSMPNFDADYRRVAHKVTLVNDLRPVKSDEVKALIERMVKTHHSELLDAAPACSCENYNDAKYLGETCPECHTVCAPITERPIDSEFWFEAPEGVEGFIALNFLDMLKDTFDKRNFSVIAWILDPRYRTKMRSLKSAVKDRLETYNIKPGINNFIQNFDEIMSILMSDSKIKPDNSEKVEELQQMILMYRDDIFPKHLPLPTSLAFIKQVAPTATYVDGIIDFAIEAVRTMFKLYLPTTRRDQAACERTAYLVCDLLTQYHTAIWDKYISKKPGLFRKHALGGRARWSFRAVISSITAVHDRRELHIPWAMGISLFDVHLTKDLMELGFSSTEAATYLRDKTYEYDELLDELMTRILHSRQTWDGLKGQPCIFQRNPSIRRLFGQNLIITKVKTDVTDITIGISVLVIKGPNADFDGKWLPSLNFSNCREANGFIQTVKTISTLQRKLEMVSRECLKRAMRGQSAANYLRLAMVHVQRASKAYLCNANAVSRVWA